MKTVHITLTMPLKWPKLFTFWRLVTFANIFWDLATFQRRGSKFSQTKLMFFSSQRILKLIKKWRLTLVFVFKRRLIVDDCYFWLYFGKQSIGCMNLDEITSHSLRWYICICVFLTHIPKRYGTAHCGSIFGNIVHNLWKTLFADIHFQ